MKLLSVASLTGLMVILLVSANWVPSAQAEANYICAGGPGAGEVQVGTSGGSPICEKRRPSGGGSNSGSSAQPSPDPLQSRIDSISSVTSALKGNLAEQERLIKSPKYQAYMRGGWEFSEGKNGQSCSAMFWRKNSILTIFGPSENYKGSFVAFMGEDVPRPASVEKIKVTLTQTDYPSQTTQAHNFKLPNASWGSIVLGFPTIEGALAAMKDTHRYDLAMEGKSVVNIEWYGGLAARDRLRKCLNARVNK